MPTIRRALMTCAVAAPLLAFAAEAPPQAAAGLKDCPPLEALRQQDAANTAARQPKPLDAAPKNPALRTELLAMMTRDQDARSNAAASAKANGGRPNQAFILAILQADQEHQSQLRKWLDDGTLPTAADVGRDGLRAIWLVAVHADRDPELQRRLLDALEPMAARGDLSAQDVAQLADKIHVARGEPQRYGTQFRAVGGVNRPQPIADAATLDARRAEAGMLPMRDYGCLMQQFHGIPVDLTPLAPAAP